MMNRKQFRVAMLLCISGVMLMVGCTTVNETDGSSTTTLGLVHERNMRTRNESAWGKGGWAHDPDTVSVHRPEAMSAAVANVLGRKNN